MSFSGLNAGTEMSAPVVTGIANSAVIVLHPTYQADTESNHSLQSTGLMSQLFGGHESGVINAGVLHSIKLNVTRALCAGTLSC